jgi:hypothetical protein
LFLFVGCWRAYIGTIGPNCDRHDAIRRIGGSKAHLLPEQADAADLYFKQTVVCPCGYRDSSPHKSIV